MGRRADEHPDPTPETLRPFRIWSHEHNAWWGHASSGYTNDLSQAGRYTYAEAADITVQVIPPGTEVAVRVGFEDGVYALPGYKGPARPQKRTKLDDLVDLSVDEIEGGNAGGVT